jgi:hypothetical protein
MKKSNNSNISYIIRIIVTLIILLVSFISFAETKREGNTFKTEQTSTSNDTQTKYTWEDKEGKQYPIYITKKGACYVKRISKKTGKEYKYYLPKDVQETIKKELGYE